MDKKDKKQRKVIMPEKSNGFRINENIKRCIYTLMLIITCFIASPIIFKQIWDSSKNVTPASSKKPPVIDLNKISSKQTGNSSDSATATTTTIQADGIVSGYMAETTTYTTEEITTQPEPTAPAFVKSDASYFDDALFIGDSRTVGLYEYGTLKNADYFCSVGLASYKIFDEYIGGQSIYDKLSYNNYGKIYIMLGINECGNDFDYTVNSFSNLLDTVRQYQPDAIVYILGSLHVTQLRDGQGDSVTNYNINSLNDAQASFADDDKIFYLDVNEVFDDENGYLMAECSNDGVHVIATYYQTWCDWLCMNTIPVESAQVPEEITTDEYVAPAMLNGEDMTTEAYIPDDNNYYNYEDNYNDYNYDNQNIQWNY